MIGTDCRTVNASSLGFDRCLLRLMKGLTTTTTTPTHTHHPHTLFGFASHIFLPKGYPTSVSPDYLTYQLFDTLQGLASYIAGTLSSRALLVGMGVGSASATPAAAMLVTLTRDSVSMISSLTASTLAPHSIALYPRGWRLVADVLNDAALMVELGSALAPPSAFVPLVALAAGMRAVVGVAGGSTRAVFRAHQARNHNLSDVAAKDGGQEIAVSLLGLLAGFILTPIMAHDSVACWVFFLLAIALHLWANYAAVSSLILDSLNPTRTSILIASFLEYPSSTLPSPAQLASSVPFFPSPFATSSPVPSPPVLGCQAGDLKGVSLATLKAYHAHGLPFIADAHNHVAFLVSTTPDDGGAPSPSDTLRSYFFAHVLHARQPVHITHDTLSSLSVLFSQFLLAAQSAGWETSRIALPTTSTRVSFV